MIAFYLNYSPNLGTDENIKRGKLISEGTKISGTLISSGVPQNWNESTVIVIGLTENNIRLNETKFLQACNLTTEFLKQSLGVDDEFYVELQNSSRDTLNISAKCGFGSMFTLFNDTTQSCPKFNLGNQSPEHLIKIQRLLIYDNKIIKLLVYTWV